VACRRWHLVQCGSLVFATSVVDAPHRIETPARLLFRGIPVRAVQLRPSRPEGRPRRFRTPLLGFIDRPSVDTTILRRHPPRPSPGLRTGTATSRSCSAPAVPPGSSGFLRSEQIRRSARSMVRGFVAPRSRPWGSPRFGLPDSASQPSLRPEGRGPEGPSRNRPLWRGPFEAFPSSAAVDHAVTAPRPFGRGRVHRLAFPLAVGAVPARVSPRRAALLSTSGLSSTEESVAFVGRCHPATARCSLGLWIDSFRRCRAHRAAQLALDIPPGGPNRFGVPSPEREGKAGCFGPVWLLATGIESSPKGRPCSIAVAPATPEGVASAASPTGHEGDASGSAPRGGPPRRSVHPKASGFRRHRDASPKRLVRDPALAPKSGGRWFELLPSVLPRLPAYMMERPLAADTRARRREHLRATRAHPRGMLRRTPLPIPEGLERRASRRRHPEVGPYGLVTPTISSKLEVPAQGQTVVVFTRTAETRSEDEVSPPIRRSE